MDAFASPDPESLVAHAAALRALARGLVGGDPHTAEDLVQETWARALEHPPRHTERLRGWLATVLASVAAKRRRTEARRSSRERRSARSEMLASEVELAHEHEERKRVLQRVSEALLALEEPYQSTLLLRYYEGLTPTVIARRTGAPLATVKSRLQRGLAHLRAQLDDEAPRARWLPALCALTGIERSWSAGLPVATATSVATGALVMSKKSGLALAALLLLLVGVGTWRTLAPDARPRGDGLAALTPPAPTPAGDGERLPHARAPVTAAARANKLAPANAPVAPTEATREHRLLVLVTDEDDRPLAGARVYAAPPSCPLNALGETDDDGRLELRWLARAKSMELAVLVVHDAWGTSGLRRVETEKRERTFAVQLRVPWFGTTDNRVQARRQVLVETGTSFPDSGTGLGLEPDARFDDEGRVVFVDPWERTVAPRARSVELGVPAEERSKPRTGAARAGVAVRGTAHDESGAPIAGVLVVARHTGGSERRNTDELGAFGFDELSPGTLVLSAGGREHALVEHTCEGRPGLTEFWNPQLARSRELRGSVVDHRGEPGGGWVVELLLDARAEARADTTLLAADGSFAFPDVPAGVHAIALRPTDRPGGIPALVEERVRTGRELELRVERRRDYEGQLELRLEDADGRAVQDGEVRAWTRDGAHGVRLLPTGDGLYSANKLPPGRYRLEASRPGASWVDRSLPLRPGANDELAPLTLDRDGRLVVVAPEHEIPVRWTLFEETGDVDRFVGEREATGGWERKLRAGRFVLRTGERELRFVVRPGETTRVGP